MSVTRSAALAVVGRPPVAAFCTAARTEARGSRAGEQPIALGDEGAHATAGIGSPGGCFRCSVSGFTQTPFFFRR